jgi:hypothetical protein
MDTIRVYSGPILNAWIGRFLFIGIAATAFAYTHISPLYAEATSKTIEVVAVVKPRLSLDIEPETGTRIDFGTITSSATEEEVSEPVRVNIRVSSNMGSPYEVTSQLIFPLTNEEGIQIPAEALIVLPQENNTASSSVSESSSKPSRILVYQTNASSSNHTFSYQLKIPPKQAAGTYRGTLLMTLTAQ